MSRSGTPRVALKEIVSFLDGYLDTGGTPDYPGAVNGLQVAGPERVGRFAVAVDARESVIAAVGGWADLLIVHHGLFWGGLRPLTGPRYRRVKALIDGKTALYSAHLPLDSHPEAGNAVILARKLRLSRLEPFGDYRGAYVGWRGRVDSTRRALADFTARLSEVLGRDVTTIPGGPAILESAAVVTGAGASTLEEAAEAGERAAHEGAGVVAEEARGQLGDRLGEALGEQAFLARDGLQRGQSDGAPVGAFGGAHQGHHLAGLAL